jgi:two-component system, OmpR family, sensor histidine kinase TctE
VSRPYSLRRRLLWVLFASLALIGAVALVDTWGEAVNTSNTASDRVLAGSVLAIAERVIVTERGALEVDVPYVALEMLTSSAQDRVFYRVDGPDGFITGYEQLPTGEASGTLQLFDAQFRGEPIRVAVLGRSASSGDRAIPFSVTVAETTIARTQLAQTLLFRSAARLALLIAAAAVILWIAVDQALKPLNRLSRAIAARSPEDLSPVDAEAPREVRYLVDAINLFMGRLAGAIQALRHFTGNASHQLRTPLSIVRTQLALARRLDVPEQRDAALATADESVAQAERILAQMLVLAHVDKAAIDGLRSGTSDLAAIAREETMEHVLTARAAGIDLGFDGPQSAMVHGDPVLLRELVRNLIDNAIAYAGADCEATVRVLAGQTIDLIVADTGRGVTEAVAARLGERFLRGTQSGEGAGLGLAIVDEIATLFSGTLRIAAPPGGGFTATVSLPSVR